MAKNELILGNLEIFFFLTFKKFKPNEPKYVDRNIQNVFETT